MAYSRQIFVAIGIGLAISIATTASASGWLRDVDHALGVAREAKRPMILFVSMDGCHHCDRMIMTTFRDTGVRRTLGSSFIAAAIKGSERPDLMKQLEIQSFPTTLIVSSDGRVLGQMVGYVSPEKFQRSLHGIVRREQAAAGKNRQEAPSQSSYALKPRVDR